MPDDRSRIANLERAIARGNFRFAVSNPITGFSSTWASFANKSDFYIGGRSFLGSLKISLHASGNNRIALTESQIERMRVQGLPVPEDRAFVKWKSPPVPELGVVQLVQLTFPANYLLAPTALGTPRKPLIIFDSAPPGRAVQIGYFLSREAPETLQPKLEAIGFPIVRCTLENGHSISVVGRETTFDDDVLPAPKQLRGQLKPLDAEGKIVPGVTHMDLTMMLWNAPKDGEPLQVIEVGGVAVRHDA